jgi:hypothetical protein
MARQRSAAAGTRIQPRTLDNGHAMTYDAALADRVCYLIGIRLGVDFTGKPMRNMAFVEVADVDDAALSEWADAGADFDASLPPK